MGWGRKDSYCPPFIGSVPRFINGSAKSCQCSIAGKANPHSCSSDTFWLAPFHTGPCPLLGTLVLRDNNDWCFTENCWKVIFKLQLCIFAPILTITVKNLCNSTSLYLKSIELVFVWTFFDWRSCLCKNFKTYFILWEMHFYWNVGTLLSGIWTQMKCYLLAYPNSLNSWSHNCWLRLCVKSTRLHNMFIL